MAHGFNVSAGFLGLHNLGVTPLWVLRRCACANHAGVVMTGRGGAIPLVSWSRLEL